MASPSFDFTEEFLRLGLHGKLETINKMVEEHFHGEGVSPLHLAAEDGDVLVCEYLIEERKIDVDIRNSEEETPLHAAVKARQFLVAHYLLKSGAKPNSATSTGVTVLHYAATGSKELINLLISRGADVNAVFKYNATPLHCAACGKEEAVRILLDNGANEDTLSDLEKKAHAAYKRKEYLEAIDFYTEILKRKPCDKEALLYRGTCWAFLRQSRPALADADLCIKIWPDIAEGYSLKGVILTKLTNEPAKAADTYSQALLLSPENVEFQQAYWKAIVAEFDSTRSLCDLESLGFKTQQR